MRSSDCSWTGGSGPRTVRPLWLLLSMVLALPSMGVLLNGCRGEEPSRAETLGLAREYVDVEHREDESAAVLRLQDDGSFVFLRGPIDRSMVEPPVEPIAHGTWAYDSDSLRLNGDGWTASFVADSIWVEIPARGAVLSSLRWVTSTEGSPFSACNLVTRSEFHELLHPSAGSGSSQSGW